VSDYFFEKKLVLAVKIKDDTIRFSELLFNHKAIDNIARFSIKDSKRRWKRF